MIVGLLKKNQRVLSACQLLNNNVTAVQKQTQLLTDVQMRNFTAQEPTAEQLEQGKQQWGEKYQDEAFRFEQEWKKISDKVQRESFTYVQKELSEVQKKKVEMLADKVMDLNMFELKYFNEMARDRLQKTSGMNPFKINIDWPSVKADETGMWPPANPNWFKQQEMLAQLGPAMSAMGMAFGAAGAQTQAAAAPVEAKAEAPKEEEKKEKSHYDIELTKFDAAKKITLIKEVRGILGLGLKEAKELVEGAPVWLKKEVKKEEAEKLVEKLKENGAECRLA